MPKYLMSTIWLAFCLSLFFFTFFSLFKGSIFTHFLPFYQVLEVDNRSYFSPQYYTSKDCRAEIIVDYEFIDEIIQEELRKYPLELQSLQYQLLLCDERKDYATKGMYLHNEQSSIIHLVLHVNQNIETNTYEKEQFIQLLHHELFHVIDFLYLEEEWHHEGYFLQNEGQYYDYNQYISPYAQSNSMEDRAETFRYLMWEKEKNKVYFHSEELKEKALQLQNELHEAFPHWDHFEKKERSVVSDSNFVIH